MLPGDLKAEQFKSYPPEARKLATEYLRELQQLPLSFLPSLLRELIDYDFRFPAERRAQEGELANLRSLSADQLKVWFEGFAGIRLSAKLEKQDWVNAPAQFVEQLSAHLWTTHQLDAFRQAATDYGARLQAAVSPESPPLPRLAVAVIGQGVASYDQPLFRKLRPLGALFTRVKPDNGLMQLLNAVSARARSHPVPYGHWYIDGGKEADYDALLTCVSYHRLEPARSALMAKVRSHIEKPGMGPEALRTLLARMRPEDLGMAGGGDPVLDRFQIKLLTEGSGTQIFSTTFAQWAAREALRRAQPLTLLVRFAPRQRQRPMNELWAGNPNNAELDPMGSLVDADMASYYTYLNQQRLTGFEHASFLAWFEGHNQAVAIGPGMPRGTESSSAADLQQLLSWIS